MNVQEINKALVRFTKAGKRHATEASEDTATGEDTGKDTAPTVKDEAYFWAAIQKLNAEMKQEGTSMQKVLGYGKKMSYAA
jgi:hypothetical protein